MARLKLLALKPRSIASFPEAVGRGQSRQAFPFESEEKQQARRHARERVIQDAVQDPRASIRLAEALNLFCRARGAS